MRMTAHRAHCWPARLARGLAAGMALALLGGCGGAVAHRQPGSAGHALRVVSINPCIDAVLVRVADPAQIAGISRYSQDPQASSIPLGIARRFRATSGTAEEVMALSPDLVLAGSFVEPATLAAFRRLGIRLLQYDVPATIDESIGQMRAIAAAVGHAGRGEALARQTQRAIAAARADLRSASGSAAATPALIWARDGLVPGAGTLADDVLHTSGFHNLSRSYGLRQWDILPLEYLVAHPPRVLLSAGNASHDDRVLGHPVLQQLAQRIAVRHYPEHLLHCAGPVIIEAVTRLAAIRRSL